MTNVFCHSPAGSALTSTRHVEGMCLKTGPGLAGNGNTSHGQLVCRESSCCRGVEREGSSVEKTEDFG